MNDLDRYDTIRAVAYTDGVLRLLDQRRLPFEEVYLDCRDAGAVASAITDLVVRGAPAIGIAAAYGVVLEARRLAAAGLPVSAQALDPALRHLNAARPTAVNLAWALARMRRVAAGNPADPVRALTDAARKIQEEDLAANRRMGALGAALLGDEVGVLTHCNTGSLATAGFGTALGVIRAGFAAGKIARVYAGETRPWLQGARLTMWEFARDGIPATLIADSAAAHLMKSGAVQWVIVGADRIVANGDTANKIGTYQLAIAARHHGVKVMVVAPASTVDMQTADGAHIDIELRDPAELLSVGGKRTVVDGAAAWNPVFDVTPAALIDAIVTERGAIERPDAEK
ncbi:MAG TPA: S-methyl-5-thioribose-1-phosphate isomerase, partial [Rudaea sp.]|nr:S-methyl-5-thioribose-1-phosphate isomerase [Rudaea sp.]